MASPSATSGARSGLATPLVLLLLLAVAAMAYYAIVPDCRRARDGVRVELAARAAARCDFAAREYARRGWVESVTNVTPRMADEFYERIHQPPVEWPAAADRASIDFSDTNGVTVSVLLHGGPRRVSAADLLAVPEAKAEGGAEQPRTDPGF
jgi:hypothetical protein